MSSTTRSLLSPAAACYHPLLLFNQHGDCLTAKLRPGNVSSAEDWDELLLPEIERQQAEGKQVTFRADAAFAKPEIYEALEERGVKYVIRIPANKNLEMEVADLLFRSPGRPSTRPLVRYRTFRYQAASWSKPRRIVAKVELHPGELFGRPGFIVTNMSMPSRSVVRFYNKRGTAEQWIKEGKQATSWTKGWTRRQAIDHGIPVSEVERYVVWPGQACAHRTGQLRIVELRERAKEQLGERFSLEREEPCD